VVSDADRRVLAFAAEHRLVLAAHVSCLLGVSPRAASARLRALRKAGHLRYHRKLVGPGCYQIDRSGLAVLASTLPRPRDIDLAGYRHDVGLAWLWLAAQWGTFGPLDRVVSEREMRSHDGRRDGRAEPLGVRLPGVGPRGGDRRHYPDLVLETATGHRVAIELELTTKTRGRRNEILGGYAIDSRIDAVLYLAETTPAMRAIERSAAELGISSLIRVQRVSFAPGSEAERAERSVERSAPRARRREHIAQHRRQHGREQVR
jgi:DNA-binding transcriptional ArsR family regulator